MANHSEHTSPASIANVAAVANVSTATVSRVLSGRRTKDDDIARRVRKAAADLNYSVNLAASALRSDVTNTIGVIATSLTDPFAAAFIDHFEPAAHARGKQLLLSISDNPTSQAERIQTLIKRKIDGLVILAPSSSLPQIAIRAAEVTTVLQVGGTPLHDRIPWIGITEADAIELALAYLTTHSAHEIALFGGTIDSTNAANTLLTFQTCVRALHLTTASDWTQFGKATSRHGYEATMRIFDGSGQYPDAIVCTNDRIAAGTLAALLALGVRVPEDVQVIGIGDQPQCPTLMVPLTSMRPPYLRIASEALRILDPQIPTEGTKESPLRLALPVNVAQRQSTIH